ncbi:MAG: hypothetical protein JWM91_3502 [Rhodospirillales bacterium]|nr:hypothetical protein [Rhodospirillales bacterium]
MVNLSLGKGEVDRAIRRIGTCSLYLPNVAPSQAELHPVPNFLQTVWKVEVTDSPVALGAIESVMTHIQGHDRSQLLLLPEAVDDYVGADNPVRFIEAFVDGLDLQAAGFARV